MKNILFILLSVLLFSCQKDNSSDKSNNSSIEFMPSKFSNIEKEILKNGKPRLQNLGIIESDIALLENEIDAMETQLPQMTHFVLPGGHPTVSHCHIARCICRRAERMTVHLSHNETVPEIVISYLNRLSDYLFVLARKLSLDLNAEEVKWIPRK